MTRRTLGSVGASCVLLLAVLAGQTSAQTTVPSQYDVEADLLLKGQVVKVDWVAGQPSILLNVTAASGVSTKPGLRPKGLWTIETSLASGRLSRSGINPGSVAPGIIVVVRGYWAKDRECSADVGCKAYGLDITIPDGRSAHYAPQRPTGSEASMTKP